MATPPGTPRDASSLDTLPEMSLAIKAIRDSRPPATDRFTYLTIIESHLSPEILPTLNEVLQDASLAQDIGWDLVKMLISLPESEQCLETIARLGNPREVILQILTILDEIAREVDESPVPEGKVDSGDSSVDATEEPPAQDTSGDDLPIDFDAPLSPSKLSTENEKTSAEISAAAKVSTTSRFITLMGMLAILHRRLKTKHPSRFLATSLRFIYAAYHPTTEITASVINLIRSLAGLRRPPLPCRMRSIRVRNLDADGDASRNAGDPEQDAEQQAPAEADIQKRLLLSFVTCIISTYVNSHELAWSARLYENLEPFKIVPGRVTAMQAFRQDPELYGRDQTVGQLVALTRDLGLRDAGAGVGLLHDLLAGLTSRNPMSELGDRIERVSEVPLMTSGSLCILAYWYFSSTLFDSDQPTPELYIFPDHCRLLRRFMDVKHLPDPYELTYNFPGTLDALLALGLWLQDNGMVRNKASARVDYMAYHHLITLIAVYHPAVQTRNAATNLAGLVLHADPNERDRVAILQDLLENCMFPHLKACAVTWLRDEFHSTHKAEEADARATTTTTMGERSSLRRGGEKEKTSGIGRPYFATPGPLDALLPPLYPSLKFLRFAPCPPNSRPLAKHEAKADADADAASKETVAAEAESPSPNKIQPQFPPESDLETLPELLSIDPLHFWVKESVYVLQVVNLTLFLYANPRRWAHIRPERMTRWAGEYFVRPLWCLVERYREHEPSLAVLEDRLTRLAELVGEFRPRPREIEGGFD